MVIVSGYAGGIDLEVHHTCLKKGGRTIIILAEGLLNFKVHKALEEVWDWGRVLVISEFLPNAIWMSSRAMQRNATIIALSLAMVLIEAGENGGSMDAGKKTLAMHKQLYTPVYNGMPDTAPGNNLLIEQGAAPLYKNKDTGKANLTQLLHDIENARYRRDIATQKNELFEMMRPGT
jgi:DNA processing protein